MSTDTACPCARPCPNVTDIAPLMAAGKLVRFARGQVLWNLGEPAKHVIRPGAGPMGLTLKAPDREVAQAYLRACAAYQPIPPPSRAAGW